MARLIICFLVHFACGLEPGNPEGPMGDLSCSDLLDNDCDGLVDGADPDCQ